MHYRLSFAASVALATYAGLAVCSSPERSLIGLKLQLMAPALAQSAPTQSNQAKPLQASGKPRIHVVVAGDTVQEIALQYGTTQEMIRKLNPGVDSSRLTVGQQIKLPPLPLPEDAAPPPEATTIPAERSVSRLSTSPPSLASPDSLALSFPETFERNATPSASERSTNSTSVSPLVLVSGTLLAFTAGNASFYLLSRRRRPEQSADQAVTVTDQGPEAQLIDNHRRTDGSWVAAPVVSTEPARESSSLITQEDSVVSSVKMHRLDVVEELISELQSGDRQRRQKAIWELSQKGDSRAVKPLVHLLMDSDSKLRSLILAALSEIGSTTVAPMHRALVLSLQDENPEVRLNAIRDLTRVFDLSQRAAQILTHALDDPDPEVQETARWAAGRLGASQLLTLSSSPNPAALAGSVEPQIEGVATVFEDATNGESADRR